MVNQPHRFDRENGSSVFVANLDQVVAILGFRQLGEVAASAKYDWVRAFEIDDDEFMMDRDSAGRFFFFKWRRQALHQALSGDADAAFGIWFIERHVLAGVHDPICENVVAQVHLADLF